MCVAFSFPYIKINGKHFANVKCHIKGKNMKDIGHINNDTNDKFYLSETTCNHPVPIWKFYLKGQ